MRGEPQLELGVHVFGIMWNYFGIHQIMPQSSIVFYLEMKVEVGVHDIRSRFKFTPRGFIANTFFSKFSKIEKKKIVIIIGPHYPSSLEICTENEQNYKIKKLSKKKKKPKSRYTYAVSKSRLKFSNPKIKKKNVFFWYLQVKKKIR